jgi:signal transduction histidine kinase
VAFAILMAFVVILGAAGLTATLAMRSQLRYLSDNLGLARQANTDVLLDMTNAETGLRGYLLSHDRTFLQPYRSGTGALPGSFATVERHLGDDTLARNQLAAQQAAASEWYRNYAEPIIAGASRAAAAGKRDFDAFRMTNTDLRDLLERHHASTVADLNRTELVMVILVGGCLAIGLVVGTRVAVVTTRRLVRPLTAVTVMIRSLALGRLDTRVAPSGPAEIQDAGRSVNALADQLGRAAAERDHSAARLQKANDELEAFSYSVSHDLRAPLRAVSGFSRILIDQHADEMSEQARGYLSRVEGGAQRMGALIDDLLAFAHVGRQTLTKHTVHPADLARACLAELSDEREGRNIEITIEDLPDCQADAALLKLVYTNLLSNALKYSRGRDPARIQVVSRRGSADTVYVVADNGAGFDPRYADKVFGVFQRLHAADQFEGTGVGLALANRIIHRHGGQIWADGKVDQGATFSFTLTGAEPS